MVGLYLSYIAGIGPDSFLGQNRTIIPILAGLPLLSWILFWRLFRIRRRRCPVRIGIGEDGVTFEFEGLQEGTKRVSWEGIHGVRVFQQPLGWGPVAYLVLRDGKMYMEAEIWGEAALELKERVEEFKRAEHEG